MLLLLSEHLFQSQKSIFLLLTRLASPSRRVFDMYEEQLKFDGVGDLLYGA